MLQACKYKVKLTPGTVKKGKAVRSVMELLIRWVVWGRLRSSGQVPLQACGELLASTRRCGRSWSRSSRWFRGSLSLGLSPHAHVASAQWRHATRPTFCLTSTVRPALAKQGLEVTPRERSCCARRQMDAINAWSKPGQSWRWSVPM
jgi:hypothetical protein